VLPPTQFNLGDDVTLTKLEDERLSRAARIAAIDLAQKPGRVCSVFGEAING
jgi:hypothetical protein